MLQKQVVHIFTTGRKRPSDSELENRAATYYFRYRESENFTLL
jgi:hypothetical protein